MLIISVLYFTMVCLFNRTIDSRDNTLDNEPSYSLIIRFKICKFILDVSYKLVLGDLGIHKLLARFNKYHENSEPQNFPS